MIQKNLWHLLKDIYFLLFLEERRFLVWKYWSSHIITALAAELVTFLTKRSWQTYIIFSVVCGLLTSVMNK